MLVCVVCRMLVQDLSAAKILGHCNRILSSIFEAECSVPGFFVTLVPAVFSNFTLRNVTDMAHHGIGEANLEGSAR